MRIFYSTLLLFCIMATTLVAHGQSVSYYGGKKVAIVLYKRDARGIYQRSNYVDVSSIDKSAKCYAYNKKSNLLFAQTEYGNFLFSINEQEAKIVKKDRSILQLEGEELETMVKLVNDELDEKFAKINAIREQQIADSIAEVREQERLYALELARQDSIRRVEEAQRMEQYRLEHDWRDLPMRDAKVTCVLCDESFYVNHPLHVETICNDTLYYVMSSSLLGVSQQRMHVMAIPQSMRNYEPFRYHCEAFKDSIAAAPIMDQQYLAQKNEEYTKRFKSALNTKAPYGFFLEWNWDESYSMVTFDFTYLNTNKKTIKYIDVYWKILNDVNDVRKTGHFKGTGPVAQYETGRWSWDNSSYFVAGDATRMELTKVIITYMNGSQQTLTKKMIFTETDFSDE